MRALVISSPEKPVDVIQIPDNLSVHCIEQFTRRLDAAGVEYELLPVSLNGTITEFGFDIDRYAPEEVDDDLASMHPDALPVY